MQSNGTVIGNRGQRTAGCTKGTSGEYTVTWTNNYPGDLSYIVHLTPFEGEVFVSASNRASTQVRVVTTSRTGSGTDNGFFITIY